MRWKAWAAVAAVGAFTLAASAWYTGPSGRWAGSGNPSSVTVRASSRDLLQRSIIVVPCEINGHATHCMIDTGFGGGMMVAPELAVALGLHPTASGAFDWPAFSSPSFVEEAAPVDVTIAGRGGPVSAAVGDWGGAKPYAIVGLQVLAQVGSTITIDLPAGTVAFSG